MGIAFSITEFSSLVRNNRWPDPSKDLYKYKIITPNKSYQVKIKVLSWMFWWLYFFHNLASYGMKFIGFLKIILR